MHQPGWSHLDNPGVIHVMDRISQQWKAVRASRLLLTVCLLLMGLCAASTLRAATMTLFTNVIGSTPDILAYNSGHFFATSHGCCCW